MADDRPNGSKVWRYSPGGRSSCFQRLSASAAPRDRDFAPKRPGRDLIRTLACLGISMLRYNERCLRSVCSKRVTRRTQTTARYWQNSHRKRSIQGGCDFSMASRLKQLNRIAIGIFNLDLFAARAFLHFVSKTQTRLFELSNACR